MVSSPGQADHVEIFLPVSLPHQAPISLGAAICSPRYTSTWQAQVLTIQLLESEQGGICASLISAPTQGRPLGVCSLCLLSEHHGPNGMA
jgi:hypothetical protein